MHPWYGTKTNLWLSTCPPNTACIEHCSKACAWCQQTLTTPFITKSLMQTWSLRGLRNAKQAHSHASPYTYTKDQQEHYKTKSYYGSFRKAGCNPCSRFQYYAHNLDSLNKKNGMSATPLNWLLKAFTLALNDSAPALVCLFTKKLSMVS